MLSSKEDIHINPAKAQVPQKRKVERMQELEDGEECCEMTRHFTALMNSQELWLPAQNQTSQHSSIDWGGAPPIAKELFATDKCGGSKVIDLQGFGWC